MRRALLLACGWLALAGAGLAQPAAQEPIPPDASSADRSPAGGDYPATRGLRLGETGLRVGAFSTLEYDKETDRPGTVALDSVNPLVLWEPVGFARAFAELEIGQLFSWEPSTGEVASDVDLTVERLYGELSAGDALNLRVGKFQTPVGIWNLVPAEPFTWTTTTPVLVDALPEHQTGGALFGSFYPGGTTIEYWAYGQFMDPLDPDDTSVDRAAGGRLRVAAARGQWALGGSFLASQVDGRWNRLGGLDVFWSGGPVELQAEFALVRGDIPDADFNGAYVQAAYHVGGHVPRLRGLYLVGRYEAFDREGPAEVLHIGNIGLAFLPKPFLNLKLGGQLAAQPNERAPRGVFASVSLVF